MTKTVERWGEYRTVHGQKAINRFFGYHKDLEYWRETLEWMLESGTDFFCDNVFADGTMNRDWSYALHLDDDEDFTYICIIERA